MGACLSRGNSAGAQVPHRGANVLSDGMNDVVVWSRSLADLEQHATHFSHMELSLATDYFNPTRVIGEGSFGNVYRGVIDANVRAGYQSKDVAVKVRLPWPDGPVGDKEWLREVNYLGQLRHPNIVRLIGFGYEGNHVSLVYEYMQRGSLDNHIYPGASNPLTWLQRMRIALGAARGLAFVHNAERKIIIRDFKTANILLDEDLNVKLSDFGHAVDEPSRGIAGTAGYIDPDYVATGRVSEKSDVYAFGVVLLEILAGREVLDDSMPEKERDLVKWGRPKLKQYKKLLTLLDSRMSNQCPQEATMEVANLTYKCLSIFPMKRPDMTQVVATLQGVVQTQNSTAEAATSQAVAATSQAVAATSQVVAATSQAVASTSQAEALRIN